MLTSLNVVAQGASFLLFAAIAKLFGATPQTDAFFLAFTIPLLFVGPVVTGITSVFIPVLTECRLRHPDAVGRLLGSTLVNVLVLTLVGVGLFAAGAPVVLPAAAAGLAPEARAQVVHQTFILLPLIVSQSLAGVVAAAYNSVGRFAFPAWATVARHLSTLGLILALRPALAITSLPVAFMCGGVVQLGILAGAWRRLGLPIHWTWRVSPEFRRSLALAAPLVLGTIALSLVMVVSRFFAARLGPGSVTVFDYGSRIAQALLELLTGGVLLVSLASWSELVARGDARRMRENLRQTLLIVMFLMLPVVAILYILRVPVTSLILQRGHFDASRAVETAGVFGILLLGLPLDMAARVYVRFFLAKQSTVIMGVGAGVRLLLVLGLSLLLMHPFGVMGLAIAEAVGVGAVTLYFVRGADRMIGPTLTGTARPLARIAAGSAAAAAAALVVTRQTAALPALVVVVLGGLAGLSVYAAFSVWLGWPEWHAIRRSLGVPAAR